MKLFLCILLFTISNSCIAQQYVYVNTDSLLLRSGPEKIYRVYAVLHAGCQLKIQQSGYYKNNKEVTNRFCYVSVAYKNTEGIDKKDFGWVDKGYVVRSEKLVTVPAADSGTHRIGNRMSLYFHRSVKCSNNEYNCRHFPYPKYKGGELQFPEPVKRVYHSGPHGGCYYIGAKGQKTYVEPKLCR